MWGGIVGSASLFCGERENKMKGGEREGGREEESGREKGTVGPIRPVKMRGALKEGNCGAPAGRLASVKRNRVKAPPAFLHHVILTGGRTPLPLHAHYIAH